ncbi:MAG: Bug family tripartite tricarboxylate transporter substrate binding protein [Thermodesulfobacteriota bacterium]
MKRHTFCFLFLNYLILALLFCPGKLLGAPYYQNRVIKIISGHEAGGTYDLMGRVLARYLPKYIPGKPTIVVENMPGAGSIIAANYLYNIAKPDGLTIGAFDRGLPFSQLLRAENIKFDITKYSWLGSAAVTATILALRTDLPYKTFDDLRKANQQIYLAAVSPGTTDYQFPILLKEYLGINLKMVIVPSGAAGKLAIERKEVDGKAGSYMALVDLIQRDMVRPLIRGRISEPGIENLPVNEDLTSNHIGKAVMGMLSAPDQMGRPFVAPPKTPPEIMTILRDAFGYALKDPELQKESKKLNMPAKYVSANECTDVLRFIFTQPENIVKEFSKYIKF